MCQTIQSIPFIREVPMLAVNTVEGVVDTTVGTLRSPFSDRGVNQLRQGLCKLQSAAFSIFWEVMHLNPWHADIKCSNSSCGAVVEAFFDSAIANSHSGVMKRIYALTAIIPLTVARVIDAAIGSIAFVFAFLAAGMSETLNHRAATHLFSALSIVRDIPIGLARVMRPDATSFGATDIDEYYTESCIIQYIYYSA